LRRSWGLGTIAWCWSCWDGSEGVGGAEGKKGAHRSRSGDGKDEEGQEDRVGESVDKLTIYLMGGISGEGGRKEKAYEAEHEAVDGSETLLSVDAYSVFRAVFVGADGWKDMRLWGKGAEQVRTKDDRGNVKVAENGVDEADLLCLWPDNVCGV